MTAYLQHPNISSTGPSPALWQKADVLAAMADPTRGYHFWDDFLNWKGTVTTNVGTYASQGGGYVSYEDTGGSIAPLATEVGGVIRITTDGTDNDEVWLMPGSATSVFGKIASSNGQKLIFEARVRPGEIATRNFFVGMSEEGLAAADTITDAGALADKDLIGFSSLEGDANGLDTVYRKAGQAVQTVKDDATTLVADTWYKVGFVFDPAYGRTSKAIRFYLDGVELTDGIALSTLDDATFPDGEELHFLVGVKNGGAAATKLDVDWVRIWQSRV